MSTLLKLLLLLPPLLCGALAEAADDHDHDHHQHPRDEHADADHHKEETHNHSDHGDEHEHHDEDRVSIAPAMAEAAGIHTAVAGPGTLERQIPLYGRLITPPHLKASMRARFRGLVTAVRVNVGDAVQQGDVLALIESNESLQTYQLRAPIDGVVQSRSVNVGEVTGDTPLFELVDTRQLWAEFKVFPSQRHNIQVGQDIHIHHGDHQHTSPILSIAPAPVDKPYVIARAAMPNPDQHAIGGDLVRGELVVETVQAPLLVDNRALQTLRDQRVVFVQVGEIYELRPVTLRVGRHPGKIRQNDVNSLI